MTFTYKEMADLEIEDFKPDPEDVECHDLSSHTRWLILVHFWFNGILHVIIALIGVFFNRWSFAI